MHLDRLAKKLLGRFSRAGAFNAVLNFNMQDKPTNTINIVGAVAVYCDPEEFPCILPTDPSLSIAIVVPRGYTPGYFCSRRTF